MIFVTVGGQTPFDRLIRGVDEWAGARGRRDVFAQIGPTELRPQHIDFTEFLAPDEFRARVASAQALVAHAGMGSILTALELGRPILVLPRRRHLNETRSDHQFDTAHRLKDRGLIQVAFDVDELAERLDGMAAACAPARISDSASDQLIEALRSFIEGA